MAKSTSKRFRYTKDGFERISIWQANIGDLVCYMTSQKIYLVADKTEDSVMLVSATQQYNAYSSFEVKRLLRAKDVNADNYNALLQKLPESDKNISLEDLQLISEEFKLTGSVSQETLSSIISVTDGSSDGVGQYDLSEDIEFKYQLPESWNADNWFDSVQEKEYRTEKEVETKFILPLLSRLGYTEDDRYDAMPTSIPHGSRKLSMEIDFAMFAVDVEEIQDYPILLVEAKREHRLSRQIELEQAQLQLKSYAVGTGSRFGLITDSRIIQVLDLMPNIGSYKVLFECQRSELKERFMHIYNLVGKPRLVDYYTELL